MPNSARKYIQNPELTKETKKGTKGYHVHGGFEVLETYHISIGHWTFTDTKYWMKWGFKINKTILILLRYCWILQYL
jgi:hypothetical protein